MLKVGIVYWFLKVIFFLSGCYKSPSLMNSSSKSVFGSTVNKQGLIGT